MANGSKKQRIIDYALGMIEESAWILGMAALALAMAFVALWMFR